MINLQETTNSWKYEVIDLIKKIVANPLFDVLAPFIPFVLFFIIFIFIAINSRRSYNRKYETYKPLENYTFGNGDPEELSAFCVGHCRLPGMSYMAQFACQDDD